MAAPRLLCGHGRPRPQCPLGAALAGRTGQYRYGYGATPSAPSRYREGKGATHCASAPLQSHWSANDSDLLPNKGMS
jgi:hypothetical protein